MTWVRRGPAFNPFSLSLFVLTTALVLLMTLLSIGLVTILDRTMQPTQAAVWLRP